MGELAGGATTVIWQSGGLKRVLWRKIRGEMKGL
jgi:hypothetical protein